MLNMDYFTVLFSIWVLEHIRNIWGVLAILVGIFFGISSSEYQYIQWIVSLADVFREIALKFTSTVKHKLLWSSFSLKKQQKPPDKGTQRYYSTHRFRFTSYFIRISVHTQPKVARPLGELGFLGPVST